MKDQSSWSLQAEFWGGESSVQRTLKISRESPLCTELSNAEHRRVKKLHEAGEGNTQRDESQGCPPNHVQLGTALVPKRQAGELHNS